MTDMGNHEYSNQFAHYTELFQNMPFDQNKEEQHVETDNGKKVPKYIQAAITYKVIHNEAPNMDTKFYGYHGQKLSGDS